MIEKPNVTTLQAYRLPAGIEVDERVEHQFETAQGTFALVYPVLNEQIIQVISKRIKQNRRDYLSGLTTAAIVEIIDKAVQKWLDPNYPQRQLAELLLPAITGYDADMIRLQLKRYMRTFRKKELLRFLSEEFDAPDMLDDFRPRKSGGLSRAYGPDLIFHVLSGNVPGISVWSLVMGLLVKSAQLGKTSSAEPLMAVWFIQSLAEVDERLADSIAILPWKGGSTELEAPVLEAADAIIAYGGNSSIESIRSRVPYHKRFVAFGHKISFAMIGKEALTPDRMNHTITRLAEDVAIYDQQSCLSPQCVLIQEGGSVSPRQAAQLLSSELARLQIKRPRAFLSSEEAMAIQAERSHYRLEEITGRGVAVFESVQSTSWTVIYHDQPGFLGSSLNRTVHVFACSQLEDGIEYLDPFREYLQSCGVAVGPTKLSELAPLLGKAGVNRICPLGSMNQAKAGWHHDGRFNLLDLIRFTDMERGTEEMAEQYDPDVE